jgi:hypothetical protein
MPDWLLYLIIGGTVSLLLGEMNHITRLNARVRKVEEILNQILERMPSGSIDWSRTK